MLIYNENSPTPILNTFSLLEKYLKKYMSRPKINDTPVTNIDIVKVKCATLEFSLDISSLASLFIFVYKSDKK